MCGRRRKQWRVFSLRCLLDGGGSAAAMVAEEETEEVVKMVVDALFDVEAGHYCERMSGKLCRDATTGS